MFSFVLYLVITIIGLICTKDKTVCFNEKICQHNFYHCGWCVLQGQNHRQGFQTMKIAVVVVSKTQDYLFTSLPSPLQHRCHTASFISIFIRQQKARILFISDCIKKFSESKINASMRFGTMTKADSICCV